MTVALLIRLSSGRRWTMRWIVKPQPPKQRPRDQLNIGC
jgi:hypothetical protein